MDDGSERAATPVRIAARPSSRLLAVVVIVLALAVLDASSEGPVGRDGIHLDGQGELASLDDPGGSTGMAIDANAMGTDTFSFGMLVCRARPADGTIVVDSIAPDVVVGGVDFLGARVHSWRAGASPSGIISVAGYPPPPSMAAYPLTDVQGTTVTSACFSKQEWTEIVVGLRRTTQEAGGWDGVRVAYHVGAERRTLIARDTMIVCGRDPACLGYGVGATGAP